MSLFIATSVMAYIRQALPPANKPTRKHLIIYLMPWLQGQDYLLGSTLTEADLRLFPSLIRFDAVYFIHFKASKKRISDYPNLNRYLHTLFSLPWVAKTVDMVHIKQHYFLSHPQLNPSRIIPHTPEMFASLS